jgi:6-phosphogluconolactonase
VIYAINQMNGMLSCVDYQSTKGKSPRHFMIDPGGEFLLVANQDSNNVISFKLDTKTGKLIDTGYAAEVPTPVCVKFL